MKRGEVMEYNLLNGGLVLKAHEHLFLSDMKRYYTTYKNKMDGMFWFMNFDGSSVFYSDQRRNNAICTIDIERQREELVLDKPSYGVILEDGLLYYINENDHKVYRCPKTGRAEERIVDEQVECFILEQGQIFYSNQQGIWVCSLTGKERDKISDTVASTIVLVDDNLAFCDKSKQNILTILNLRDSSTKQIDGMLPSSMNTNGRYLYCANRLNERTIYRIEPESGSSIRICGESAEYLHIIEDKLYFCIQREWHRMSLMGGQFEKVEV